jgi:hypothetical protein
LKEAHEKLDAAVRVAFAMKKSADPLAFLFRLNTELAALEAKGKAIRGPGAPMRVPGIVTTDCLSTPPP